MGDKRKMTKEELKQEAEQYSYDVPIYQIEPQLEKIQKAYLAGAEPREKRIAKLEKENSALIQEWEIMKTTISELEAQIEKMKCLLKEIYSEHGFSELVKIRNNLPIEIQEVIKEINEK